MPVVPIGKQPSFHGRKFAVRGGLLLSALLILLSARWIQEAIERSSQTQSDPRVATAWIVGTTRGTRHSLTRGLPWQKWLNDHGVYVFGRYRDLVSRFSGDPGSVEVWFDYQSHIPGRQELECHRVGETAFEDDLGQPYHGFLDLHGKVIGVYLPGYDHAAKRLKLTLRWMPRSPSPPLPISNPMEFVLNLPPAKRVLPPAGTLPAGAVRADRAGVRVAVSEARLSAPRLGVSDDSQRTLTFRLKIEGGLLSDETGRDPIQRARAAGRLLRSVQWNGDPEGVAVWGRGRRPVRDTGLIYTIDRSVFEITDPYGLPLLANARAARPRHGLTVADHSSRTVWMAPVNGAGYGTDAVRLRFRVTPMHPPGNRPAPVLFDLTVPVQAGGEL